MWRFLFIAFLIAHGGIHVAIWATPKPNDQEAPFDASHSWLLGNEGPASGRFGRYPARPDSDGV